MELTAQEHFAKTCRFDHDETLEFHIDPRSRTRFMILIEPGCSYFHLKVSAGKSSNSKIFIQNRADAKLDLFMDADVYQDAECEIGFLDLEKNEVYAKEKAFLKEPGASFEIYTGQLCPDAAKKISDMEVVHEAPATFGRIHNFAVQFDGSYYEMVANGNIRDRCPGSQSHQETRVLTLGKDTKNKVIPLLLIDENDVKASHALSIGQPDASQMYYLQSRGLSKSAAMGLLSIGYFMPVIDMIEEESLRSKIREEMEGKVGLYGHSQSY